MSYGYIYHLVSCVYYISYIKKKRRNVKLFIILIAVINCKLFKNFSLLLFFSLFGMAKKKKKLNQYWKEPDFYWMRKHISIIYVNPNYQYQERIKQSLLTVSMARICKNNTKLFKKKSRLIQEGFDTAQNIHDNHNLLLKLQNKNP